MTKNIFGNSLTALEKLPVTKIGRLEKNPQRTVVLTATHWKAEKSTLASRRRGCIRLDVQTILSWLNESK